MIKLLACIFMLMDHFAFVFFAPSTFSYLLFRVVGRLAMPIFAYNVAVGYTYTSSLKNYIYRMSLLTIASQIPLTMMLQGDLFVDVLVSSKGLVLFNSWNIGLTFTCSLLIISFINKLIYTSKPSLKFMYFNLVVLFIFLGSFGDYGIYGISIVLIFYFLKKYSYRIQAIAITISTFCYYYFLKPHSNFKAVLYSFLLQIFCVLSLLIIKHLKDKRINLPKSFFYWFYPIHMLVLSLFKYIL